MADPQTRTGSTQVEPEIAGNGSATPSRPSGQPVAAHAAKGSLEQKSRTTLARLDSLISAQLAEILHAPAFLRLEGTWRGLRYLVMGCPAGPLVRIRVLNITKHELGADLATAPAPHRSLLYGLVYLREFCSYHDNEPYGALIGDYAFSGRPDDLALLGHVSDLAAAAFVPFISAASPALFGVDDFRQLDQDGDLSALVARSGGAAWRALRSRDAARFLCLTLPRALARRPHATNHDRREPLDAGILPAEIAHEHHCWMNSAYVLAVRLASAFCQTGWYTAIRGVDGGGRVEDLPHDGFAGDDGGRALTGPTEIDISDRSEAALGSAGLLPLCRVEDSGHAVFMGAQTLHEPLLQANAEATADAAIATGLPHVLATSRFAHYLMLVGREPLGAFEERMDREKRLIRWLRDYWPGRDGRADPDTYPLRAASVTLQEVRGAPGDYQVTAWMQHDALSTSMRTVARLPSPPWRFDVPPDAPR